MDTVSRRDALRAGACAVFVTSASGCLGDGKGGDANTVEVDSRFAGEDCPSFEDTDETRCYHQVGTQPDVRLVPEQEVGNPAEEPMTFTLHNDSDSTVWSCPPSECWNLHKLIDREWRSLTPFRIVPAIYEPLEASDSHTWNLEMSNDDVEQRDRLNPEDSEMAYTGPGTYAFRVGVSTEGSGGGDDIELVALFEMEGESLEVQEDLDSMPTELAAQLHPIKNSLAFFDRYDPDEVRLEGSMSLGGEIDELRVAEEVYSTGRDGSLIEVTEDGPVEEFPYRFRFLHEGTYYEIVVEEYEPS